MPALDGGFNRSMQHTSYCPGRRSVADEVSDANLLHGRPEGIDVGAVERWLDPSPDWPAVRPTSHLYPQHLVEDRWNSTAAAATQCQRLDAGRERRDLPCPDGW